MLAECRLYEIKDSAKEQTESLKEFFASADFAEAIRKAFDNSNDAKIVPILNEIRDTLAKSDSSKILEAMQIFIDNISEKMKEVNSSQTEGLEKSILEVQQQSRQFIEDITKTMLNKADIINQQFTAQQNEIANFQNSGKQVMEESIDNIIRQLAITSENMLKTVNMQIIGITDSLAKTQHDSMSAMQLSNKLNQEQIDNLVNNLAVSSNNILVNFDRYIDKSVTTSNQLNELIHQVLENYKQIVTNNKTALEKTYSSIADINLATQEFKAITANITSASDAISTASNSLIEVNSSIASHAVLVNDGFNNLKLSLEKRIEEWNKHIEDVGRTEDNVHSLIGSLNNVIDNYVLKFDERSYKFFDDFIGRITSITSSTNSAVSAIEEFTDQCESLLSKKK